MPSAPLTQAQWRVLLDSVETTFFQPDIPVLVATLEAQHEALEAIKAKAAWLLNDMAYKAPEQLTAEFFVSRLDMLRQEITEQCALLDAAAGEE